MSISTCILLWSLKCTTALLYISHLPLHCHVTKISLSNCCALHSSQHEHHQPWHLSKNCHANEMETNGTREALPQGAHVEGTCICSTRHFLVSSKSLAKGFGPLYTLVVVNQVRTVFNHPQANRKINPNLAISCAHFTKILPNQQVSVSLTKA